MWQLSECIDGMAEACRALSLPVIGGNVSFYNESGGADIDPTPVLGVLGLVDAVHAPPPGLAWSAGDTLVLVGPRPAADGAFPLDGTRWATERRDHRTGQVPPSTSPRTRARVRLRRRAGRRARGRCRRPRARARRARRLGRVAWPSPWPRWRPRRGGCTAGRRATPPSSSPSCPRASWWRRRVPTSCGAGPPPSGSRPRSWAGPAASGSPSGPGRPPASTRCAEAHEGNLALALGDP